jgi:hypothetical protein
VEVSHRVASMPTRYSGAGLRSAVRTSSGAHWAAWADALPFICERFPDLGARILEELDAVDTMVPALRAARGCAARLAAAGFDVPTWAALAAGLRPQTPEESVEPGAWLHGWQFYACDALEKAEAAALQDAVPAPVQALLRSQSGPGAGNWLTAIPTSAPLALEPLLFLVALRRRLFFRLPAGQRECTGCGAHLDPWGHHTLTCPRVG